MALARPGWLRARLLLLWALVAGLVITAAAIAVYCSIVVAILWLCYG